MTNKFNKLALEIVRNHDEDKRRAIMLEMLEEIQKWLTQQRDNLKKI